MDQWLAAWGIWLEGRLVVDVQPQLWGHTISWWNRFGQILQFFAALVVISEIIGKNNIQALGVNLLKIMRIDITYIEEARGKIVFISLAWTGVLIFGLLSYFLLFSAKLMISYHNVISVAGLFLAFIGLIMVCVLIYSSLIAILFTVSAVLTDKRVDVVFKCAGLFFALIGFHFTLLAS